MARVRFDGFVGASYTARSIVHGSERAINLYYEQNPSTNQPALYGTPGLKRRWVLPGGPTRAAFTASNGRVFLVAGPTLYELLRDQSPVVRGQVTGTQPVSMDDNGQALMLVDGQRGYVFTFATNTYETITDPEMPQADFVAFLDGYFVLNVHGTGRFMLTGLYDPTNLNGLDFATAEASADPIVALYVDHRELWLFGTQTIEVWFNAGTPSFPLQRIEGALIEQGCIAPWSVAALDNTLYWLHGNDRGQGAVMRARGYQPEELTPPAVEWAWGQYPRLDDAIAYTYRQSGHAYYVLSFPSGNATWAYDVSTGLWHERAFLEPDGTLARHRAHVHTYGLGAHLVGDWETGRVYELDEHTYTDDGHALPRIRRAPHLSANGLRVFHEALEVQCETGVGLDHGLEPGRVPQAMARWSNDSGRVWSNQYWTTIGPIGAYPTRAIWRRLGQSRSRVYEVSITDPVPVALTGAWLDVTTGSS